MEIFKVIWDEETGLATVTFNPEKVMEAKQYFKELFDHDCDCHDDEPNGEYHQEYYDPAMEADKGTEWTGCGECGSDPCMCEQADGTYEEPVMDQEPMDEEPMDDGTYDEGEKTTDNPK